MNQTGPVGQGPMTGRRMGRCLNSIAIPENKTNEDSEESNESIADNITGRGLCCKHGMGGRGRGGGLEQQNRFRGGC